MADQPSLERAINALELALHPNTGDGETLAAINGFRRVAKGETLTGICLAMFTTAANRDRYKRWRERLEDSKTENEKLKADLGAATTEIESYQRRVYELESRRVLPMEDPATELQADDLFPDKIERHEEIQQPEAAKQTEQPEAAKQTEQSEAAKQEEKRVRIRWTEAEWEFLARLYEDNPTMQNKVIAARCSDQFGRAITNDAIGGAIDRLRKKERLPKYRKGFERHGTG